MPESTDGVRVYLTETQITTVDYERTVRIRLEAVIFQGDEDTYLTLRRLLHGGGSVLWLTHVPPSAPPAPPVPRDIAQRLARRIILEDDAT